jgi:hypothetical protein
MLCLCYYLNDRVWRTTRLGILKFNNDKTQAITHVDNESRG